MGDMLLFYVMFLLIVVLPIVAIGLLIRSVHLANKRWKQLMNALEYERKPRD